MHQLSHNPAEHKKLDGFLQFDESRAHISRWQETFFPLEHTGLTDEETAPLVSIVKCRAFAPGELLLDRFAVNPSVCFVISGAVDRVVHGLRVSTCYPGELLHDVHFYYPALAPYNAVGRTAGVLGIIEHGAIEQLSEVHPRLTLALHKLIGGARRAAPGAGGA